MSSERSADKRGGFALIENRLPGFLIGGFAVAFVNMSNDGSGYLSPSGLVGLLCAVASAVVAIRCFRSGLFVRGSEVVVRNLFSTFRCSLGDVAAVVVTTGGVGRPIVKLRLRTGKDVKVHALDTGPLRHNVARMRRLAEAAAQAMGVAFG